MDAFREVAETFSAENVDRIRTVGNFQQSRSVSKA
jgi:hypothetical protein